MEKLITRTFTTFTASVMVCNPEKGTVETKEFNIPASVKPAKRIHYLSTLATDDCIPVKILSMTEKTTLYGMSETDFLKYSHELPPRKTNINA